MLLILAALVLGVVFVGGGVAFVLVVRDTARKDGRWGVNVQSLGATPGKCPGCAAPLPTVRRPASLRQALWGGWTCKGCGLELDKWGRPAQ